MRKPETAGDITPCQVSVSAPCQLLGVGLCGTVSAFTVALTVSEVGRGCGFPPTPIHAQPIPPQTAATTQ